VEYQLMIRILAQKYLGLEHMMRTLPNRKHLLEEQDPFFGIPKE